MQHAPHGEPGRNTAVRRHAAAERSTVTQVSILGAIARLGEANLRQLEHTLAIDQTTLTRSLKLLERNGAIDRVPHPDGRIKAMTLTSKGTRALEAARPLWARAQGKVLRELGTTAWADAQRRLAHLLRVAVKKRGRTRGQSRAQSRRARRGSLCCRSRDGWAGACTRGR